MPDKPVLTLQELRMVAVDSSSRGIECRNCGCRDFRVRYTRPKAGNIMRRRECRHCGKLITTFEREP